MKKHVLIAAAALLMTTGASLAQTTIIERRGGPAFERDYDGPRWDRGRHLGWERGRHRGWDRADRCEVTTVFTRNQYGERVRRTIRRCR